MLSRYNRRMDDDTISNYMDACKGYTENEVATATKYLTGAMERLPYPRDLEDFLVKECKGTKKKEGCSVGKCDGKGYYPKDHSYDIGLSDFDPAGYLRCSCHYATGPNLPMFISSKSELESAITVQLAGKIAHRSVDNEVINSVDEWAKYCWSRETYQQYKELAKRLNLNKLLYIDEFIRAYSSTDCQARPIEVAQELVAKTAPLPDKRWM